MAGTASISSRAGRRDPGEGGEGGSGQTRRCAPPAGSMRPLLCALAGLALLRASGAFTGEWGPGAGRGSGRPWTARKELERGREMGTKPDGERGMEKEGDAERERERKMVREIGEKDGDKKGRENKGRGTEIITKERGKNTEGKGEAGTDKKLWR